MLRLSLSICLFIEGVLQLTNKIDEDMFTDEDDETMLLLSPHIASCSFNILEISKLGESSSSYKKECTKLTDEVASLKQALSLSEAKMKEGKEERLICMLRARV